MVRCIIFSPIWYKVTIIKNVFLLPVYRTSFVHWLAHTLHLEILQPLTPLNCLICLRLQLKWKSQDNFCIWNIGKCQPKKIKRVCILKRYLYVSTTHYKSSFLYYEAYCQTIFVIIITIWVIFTQCPKATNI